MKEKENGNEPLTRADLQTILDRITNERRKGDNHTNNLITEVRNEIAEVKCKIEALQKGVSNLQSVKKDVREIRTDMKQ